MFSFFFRVLFSFFSRWISTDAAVDLLMSCATILAAQTENTWDDELVRQLKTWLTHMRIVRKQRGIGGKLPTSFTSSSASENADASQRSASTSNTGEEPMSETRLRRSSRLSAEVGAATIVDPPE